MDVQTVAFIGASLVLLFLTLLVGAMNSRANLIKKVSLLEVELELAEIKIKELKNNNKELINTNHDLNNLVEATKKSTRVAERVALEAINDITALFQVFEDQSVEPTHISDAIKERYNHRDTITTERFYRVGRL